jgi:hypothetical protein
MKNEFTGPYQILEYILYSIIRMTLVSVLFRQFGTCFVFVFTLQDKYNIHTLSESAHFSTIKKLFSTSFC